MILLFLFRILLLRISCSKATLIKNDILDNKAGEISFQTPIYAYWLKTEYFLII